jgi:hypothetical protein
MDNQQSNEINQDKILQAVDARPLSKLPYDLTNQGMGSVFGGWPEEKIKEPEKTPFFKTLKLEAEKQSPLYNTPITAFGALQSEYNFLFDNVDKEFDTANPDLYKDIPEIYWPTIRNATSPADLKRRQNIVFEEIENEKLLANGGFWPKLIGGAIGMTIGAGPIGLSKWVLPAVAEARAGTFTVDALMNSAKATPGIALDAFSYESALDLSKGRYDLEDVTIRSLEDSIFGFGLGVIGKNLKYGNDGIKIWNGRKLLGAVYHDAKLEPVFEGDKLVDLKYTPPIKEAMSAQRHAEIEGDLRSIVAETGFYGVPVVGEGLKKLTKTFNPAFRMLSSPFDDARNFFSAMANTGIRTKGELEGTAKIRSAEEYSSYFRAMGTRHRMEYTQDYYAANGLTSTAQTVNAFKNLVQTVTEKKTISFDDFGKRVRNVIATGIEDENPHVNRASKRMSAILADINKQYAEAHGMDEFVSPPNTVQYIFQNWDTHKLDADPSDFFSIASKWMNDQTDKISEIMQPITEIDERIKLAPEEEKPFLRERRAELQNQIHDQLTDNEDNHFLLKDRIILNSKDRAELKSLLEGSGVSKLTEEIKAIKQEIELSKNKDEISSLNKKLKELYDQRKTIRSKLELDARMGRINKKFYYRSEGKIKFRDPNKLPEFIDAYKTKTGQMNYLKRIQAKIIGTDATQLLDELLGHGVGSDAGTTVYTKAGYLDNDLASAMENYLGSMGRRIGLKRAFGEMYGEDGLKDIFENMSNQYRNKMDAYATIKDKNLREKKQNKLKKDFDSARSDMTAMYNIYHGRFTNQNLHNDVTGSLQVLRNMVYATRLGLLQVAQLTDSTAAILRAGIVPWLFNGLLPHMRGLKDRFQGNKTEMQEAAAVNLLGLNHVIGGLQYDLFSKGTHNYNTVIGKAKNITHTIAGVSQNLTFSNYFENLNESIAERVFQNNIIKASQKFLDGTISKSETVQMARMGIDLAEDARAIVEQFDKYGETHYNGLARNSNYQNWDNADIQEKMIMAVRSGVSDVVVKGQLFTSPLTLKDPIIGSIFMFTSWAFAATERYLLPSLQYADANTLQGFIAMQVMSSLQDPIRRMASGKPPYDEDSTLKDNILNAIMQNGFFGVIPQAVEMLNLVAHNDLLGKSQGFRYKDRSTTLGPAADYAKDVLDTAYMFASGRINKTGFKKAINLLPGSGFVYTRGLLNAWQEGLDIPDTIADAEPYKIFQRD